MKKPALIILAAGMGSRYGGLKQMDPIDDKGHVIIDYSMFDAKRAGFEKIVCVIKPELEKDFHEVIGKRVEKYIDLHYAYQTMDDIPDGYSIPEGRVKPWGTAHAVRSARKIINEPFAAINADDFYGKGAYKTICDYLSDAQENSQTMVGYKVENTLTENGSVARGICDVDEKGYLKSVVERTKILPAEGGAKFTEDDGKTFTFIPAGTLVSMNMWGFQAEMMSVFDERFEQFLREKLPSNPLKGEYFLPWVPNLMIEEGKTKVRVLSTTEKWFGVTYHEDKADVQAKVQQLYAEGVYPEGLWEAL